MFTFEVTVSGWQSMKMKSDRFKRKPLYLSYWWLCCYNALHSDWNCVRVCEAQKKLCAQHLPNSTIEMWNKSWNRTQLTIKYCPADSVMWPIQPQTESTKELNLDETAGEHFARNVKRMANRNKAHITINVCPPRFGLAVANCAFTMQSAFKSTRNSFHAYVCMCFCVSLSMHDSLCFYYLRHLILFAFKKWHFSVGNNVDYFVVRPENAFRTHQTKQSCKQNIWLAT